MILRNFRKFVKLLRTCLFISQSLPKMFEFSCWCFLCAGEIDVNVEILGLDEQIRESIGQFSIIVSNKQTK